MAGAFLKNNFNKGEIDPEGDDRIDLKPWRNAVQYGLNVEFRAKGGFVQRPALASKARLRRKLEPVVIAADQVSAPNGGDVTLLLGYGELLVENTGDDRVVLQIDFGSAQAISCFDALGFKSGESGEIGFKSGESGESVNAGGRLNLESSNNGSDWTPFGDSVDVTGEYRSRRFCVNGSLSVRYLRLVVQGLEAASSFYLKTINALVEGNEISKVALFARGDHVMALTDQNGDSRRLVKHRQRTGPDGFGRALFSSG